jgi:hypothetical protein
VWSSQGCSQIVITRAISAGMIAPCADIMPGTQLSGKTAELLHYTKGTCTPSGGEVVGELSLDKPVTVCCPGATT